MFSTVRHQKYQADLEKVARYNQRALYGRPMTDEEKQEHQTLIAEWKAYEETLNYKFFLTLSQIRHSKAMAVFYYTKRRIGDRLWCIGYDIRQAFKKKA